MHDGYPPMTACPRFRHRCRAAASGIPLVALANVTRGCRCSAFAAHVAAEHLRSYLRRFLRVNACRDGGNCSRMMAFAGDGSLSRHTPIRKRRRRTPLDLRHGAAVMSRRCDGCSPSAFIRSMRVRPSGDDSREEPIAFAARLVCGRIPTVAFFASRIRGDNDGRCSSRRSADVAAIIRGSHRRARVSFVPHAKNCGSISFPGASRLGTPSCGDPRPALIQSPSRDPSWSRSSSFVHCGAVMQFTRRPSMSPVHAPDCALIGIRLRTG